MKKVLAPLMACLTLGLWLVSAQGQQPAQAPKAQGRAAAPRDAAVPHKIGLIDMSRVFKEYKKFEHLRENLKAEYETLQAGGQEIAQKMQKVQEELKQFSQGSPEYSQREQQLVKLNAELQAYGKGAQSDLTRKESQIFRDIYTETLESVRLYSEHFKYTLILRFDSGGFDSDDPQQVLETLNQQVVYHRGNDDITSRIIKFMNDKYESSAAAQAAKPAAGARTK